MSAEGCLSNTAKHGYGPGVWVTPAFQKPRTPGTQGDMCLRMSLRMLQWSPTTRRGKHEGKEENGRMPPTDGTDESQCVHAQSTELVKDRLSHDPPRGYADQNMPALSNEAGLSGLSSRAKEAEGDALDIPVCFLLWQNQAVANPEFRRAVQRQGSRAVRATVAYSAKHPPSPSWLQAPRMCIGCVRL